MSEPANSMWMHRITYDGGDPTEWRIGKAPAYIKDGNNRVEECLFAPASPSPTSADAVVEACAKVADAAKEMRERLFEINGSSYNAARISEAEEIASTIRALKGTFPAVDTMTNHQWSGWVYDADHPMSDGGDTRMTAAEEVLAYLLIEVVGAPDDVPYSPNQAQLLLEDRLKEGKRLEEAYGEHLRQRREARTVPSTQEADTRSALVDPEGGV